MKEKRHGIITRPVPCATCGVLTGPASFCSSECFGKWQRSLKAKTTQEITAAYRRLESRTCQEYALRQVGRWRQCRRKFCTTIKGITYE